MLRNEQYNGRIVWNRRKSKKIPGTSRRIYEIRPKSEWEIYEHPELKIIDDLLWERVQLRLCTNRKKASKSLKRPRGRPSRYLLSGLLKCSECGSNFIMQDSRSYGCSSHTNGGRHLCSNGLRVRRDIAESAVLSNVQSQLLSNDMLGQVEQRVRAALVDHNERKRTEKTSVAHLRKRRAELSTKIERVVDAIESMGINATLAKRLTQLEEQLEQVEAEIKESKKLGAPDVLISDILPSLFDDWREIVANIGNLASDPHSTPDDVQAARKHLHALLGPITVKPRDGELWAHPSPNAKSLVETRLSDGLHINNQKVVAGARFGNSLSRNVLLLVVRK